MDDGTSLLAAVPLAYKVLFEASKFPKSSGNLWRFEQPWRLRSFRDFSWLRLLGRLLSLLQSLRYKYNNLERHPMDEGSSSIAVPSNHISSILPDDENSGSLFSFEQPKRLSFLRNSKWSISAGRLFKLTYSLRLRITSLFRGGINDGLEAPMLLCFNLQWCYSGKKQAKTNH